MLRETPSLISQLPARHRNNPTLIDLTIHSQISQRPDMYQNYPRPVRSRSEFAQTYLLEISSFELSSFDLRGGVPREAFSNLDVWDLEFFDKFSQKRYSSSISCLIPATVFQDHDFIIRFLSRIPKSIDSRHAEHCSRNYCPRVRLRNEVRQLMIDDNFKKRLSERASNSSFVYYIQKNVKAS